MISIDHLQHVHLLDILVERFPFTEPKEWSFCTKHLIYTESLLCAGSLFQLSCSFLQHSSGRGQGLSVQTFAVQQT